jgi:hypothetical protein
MGFFLAVIPAVPCSGEVAHIEALIQRTALKGARGLLELHQQETKETGAATAKKPRAMGTALVLAKSPPRALARPATYTTGFCKLPVLV